MADTTAIIPNDHVSPAGKCPACGAECAWNGVYATGGGTKYVICCTRCPKQVLR